MSVLNKKLNRLLKACLLTAGVCSVSFSVSAFEIQNEAIHFFGSSAESNEGAVQASSDVSSKVNDVVVVPTAISVPQPKSGEVLLQESLPTSMAQNDVLNRHSKVRILSQNNEVQFLDHSERKALLTLLSHLQQTDALIQRAQAYQRPDQRIKFRYDWLRIDLHKINRSILDHLNSPENQTRFFEPLHDDYRR